MKIAIDISPLSTGHSVRGVGFYLKHLKDSLEKYHPEHTYILFKEIKEIPHSVDLIHYPFFDPFFINYPLIKTKPTVVTVHDLIPLKFPEYFPVGIKGRLKWELNKGLLRTMDRIITDSSCSKEDIVDIVSYPQEKVDVIHLAAGEDFKKVQLTKETRLEMKEKYNFPDKFALYVGDVTWNKNLPNLVRASKEASIPLVMVGKALTQTEYDRNHPWNADLVAVQKLIEGDANFLPLGFVEDLDLLTLYNMATVFVFPSLYEGFGLPILEAMACGTPVVTTKEGSLNEIAGEAAYFVDAQGIESLTHGLKTVFHSEKLQEELSIKGLQRVHEFSWRKTASETIKIYESVVSSQ